MRRFAAKGFVGGLRGFAANPPYALSYLIVGKQPQHEPFGKIIVQTIYG
jgi:hypothetical protein